MRNTRSRKYQMTINNPAEHGWNHEAIRKEIKDKWDNVIYYCMCDEIGNEEKTMHTHVFIQFKNPVYFSSIMKVFPAMHIEDARGTAKENRDYIRKEGKYENTEKAETNLKETFEEYGELPLEGQGRRNDMRELYMMLKDGYSNTQIMERNPDNILNLHSIDKARLEIQSEQFGSVRRLDLMVIYVCGSTGVGKSRDILDKHGDTDVYRITDYKNPFDTYSGENVLVFEEFRSDIQIGSMLNYLDIYPVKLPARYNNKQACYKFVYIVSNWKLEDQYRNVQREQPETYEAFLRRIKKVRIYSQSGVFQEMDTKEYLRGWRSSVEEKTPFEKEEQ